MVFSSIIFIFYFLPVFLLGYYLAGWRTGALLVGSVAFYVWGEGPYIFLLGGLILLNYLAAIGIDRLSTGGRRTALVAATVAIDFGVLGVFKYAGFLAHNIDALLPGSPCRKSPWPCPSAFPSSPSSWSAIWWMSHGARSGPRRT